MTGRSTVRRTAAIAILLTLAAGLLAVVAVQVGLRRDAPRSAVGRAEVRVAVLSGSVEERLLRDLGLPRHRMLTVPDARTGWVAVASRSVDGLALSAPTIRWMARASGAAAVEIAEPFEPPADAASRRRGFGAFAFRLDDRSLRDAWDSVLRSFVGSDAHLRLVAPFGFTAAEMPGRVSVQDLLGP